MEAYKTYIIPWTCQDDWIQVSLTEDNTQSLDPGVLIYIKGGHA